MKDILEECDLELPLEINGKELFSICKEQGFSRYIVSLNLLDISNTTGRTISLSEEYVINISEDYVVEINRVIPVK